ncbi:MAG: hypothetical protein J3K34DRAFT_433293 [Monoraphidium minutum]|nr:MAG: hypothetical protein J3K34DRAFT_433293 [Monoraphidium minutum]
MGGPRPHWRNWAAGTAATAAAIVIRPPACEGSEGALHGGPPGGWLRDCRGKVAGACPPPRQKGGRGSAAARGALESRSGGWGQPQGPRPGAMLWRAAVRALVSLSAYWCLCVHPAGESARPWGMARRPQGAPKRRRRGTQRERPQALPTASRRRALCARRRRPGTWGGDLGAEVEKGGQPENSWGEPSCPPIANDAVAAGGSPGGGGPTYPVVPAARAARAKAWGQARRAAILITGHAAQRHTGAGRSSWQRSRARTAAAPVVLAC